MSSKGAAINTFTDGLVSDLNAITTPNSVLTDVKNGTILTFNGNELVLQNDMGNTDLGVNSNIDTTKVSLSEGFIPVGVKEHGGIIYIVSHNPSSKETEIGSFPSPGYASLIDNSQPTLANYNIEINKTVKLSNKELTVGDPFIIQFAGTYPTELSYKDNKKYYKPHIIAITASGEIDITDIIGYIPDSDYNFKYGDYYTFNAEVSTHKTYVYPNIKNGKIGIKFTLEGIEKFELTNTKKHPEAFPEGIIEVNGNYTIKFTKFIATEGSLFKISKIELKYNIYDNITSNLNFTGSLNYPAAPSSSLVSSGYINNTESILSFNFGTNRDVTLEYTITPIDHTYTYEFLNKVIKNTIDLSKSYLSWSINPKWDNYVSIPQNFTIDYTNTIIPESEIRHDYTNQFNYPDPHLTTDYISKWEVANPLSLSSHKYKDITLIGNIYWTNLITNSIGTNIELFVVTVLGTPYLVDMTGNAALTKLHKANNTDTNIPPTKLSTSQYITYGRGMEHIITGHPLYGINSDGTESELFNGYWCFSGVNPFSGILTPLNMIYYFNITYAQNDGSVGEFIPSTIISGSFGEFPSISGYSSSKTSVNPLQISNTWTEAQYEIGVLPTINVISTFIPTSGYIGYSSHTTLKDIKHVVPASTGWTIKSRIGATGTINGASKIIGTSKITGEYLEADSNTYSNLLVADNNTSMRALFTSNQAPDPIISSFKSSENLFSKDLIYVDAPTIGLHNGLFKYMSNLINNTQYTLAFYAWGTCASIHLGQESNWGTESLTNTPKLCTYTFRWILGKPIYIVTSLTSSGYFYISNIRLEKRAEKIVQDVYIGKENLIHPYDATLNQTAYLIPDIHCNIKGTYDITNETTTIPNIANIGGITIKS